MEPLCPPSHSIFINQWLISSFRSPLSFEFSQFFYIQLAWPSKEYALRCDGLSPILCECHFHPWKRWHNEQPQVFSRGGWRVWVYVCEGGEEGEGGGAVSPGEGSTNPREQKRIHIWQGFCLPWQLRGRRGPKVMNWIKCESKKARLLKGQERGRWRGWGGGATAGVGAMLMCLQFLHWSRSRMHF